MAFIPMSGGVKATINGFWNGQVTQNTLYFQKEDLSDPTLGEVATLGALLDEWYATEVLPNLNESFAYINTEVQALNVAFGFQSTSSAFAGSGTVTGESMPGNVDPCLSFRGASSGRFARGRNYIPGISSSDVVGNTIDADWMLAVAVAYNNLTQAGSFDPTPFNWVVASFYFNGAPRAAALATVITSVLFTDNIVDSQRRRLPGRGR